MTTKEVAQYLNVSKRHVRRAKQRLKKYNGLPRILLLDIETLPMTVLVWGLYKQRISPENIVQDWSILCWAAKWLYDDKIYGNTVDGKSAYHRYDTYILPDLHDLLDEADIVIAHNAKRFDLPKINTRFIINGLDPVSPYQTIDTLQVAKRNFSFSSNKLDELARQLGLTRKSDTDYSWWYNAAVHGDDQYIQKLYKYCKRDVLVLEEVYTELRPWINSHPNLGLYMNTTDPICSHCGSKDLDWGNYYYTMVGKYKSFKCRSCGAVGRNRFTEISKDKRKSLVVSTPR